MKSHLSAIGGQGQVASVVERRLVRGGPSLVESRREASKACATCGRRAVNSGSGTPVMARKLPARWVTSSELAIGTSVSRGEVGGP
jgi:hypothetical protein